MSTLEAVMAAVEAFKADMEDLGVPVSAVTLTTPAGVSHDISMLLRVLVREGLEEDLEEGAHGR